MHDCKHLLEFCAKRAKVNQDENEEAKLRGGGDLGYTLKDQWEIRQKASSWSEGGVCRNCCSVGERKGASWTANS